MRRIKKSTEKFDVRLLMINLASRLIGAHRLMLPSFYPFVMRYMQPHQRDVTSILASSVRPWPPPAVACERGAVKNGRPRRAAHERRVPPPTPRPPPTLSPRIACAPP